MHDDQPTPGETAADRAADGIPRSDEMTRLQHELRNLIDGSLRCLGAASRALPKESMEASAAQIDSTRKQLGVVTESLERMAEMLHHGLRGEKGVFGYAGRRATLAEALEHAAEVMRPLAAAHKTSILLDVAPQAQEIPAASVYPAIINALRNATEAISLCGGEGKIDIRARARHDGLVEIEIADDAHGPPPGTEGRAIVFEHRYTTKPNGGGIGLGIAAEVARELGGRAELRVGAGQKPGRPGSIFVLRYPIPNEDDERLFGEGAA